MFPTVEVNEFGQPSSEIDLYLAVITGNIFAIKSLLTKGADIHSKVKGPFTCIHVALEKDDLNIIKFLIANGADVNSRYPIKDVYTGSTLLYRSIVKSQIEIVELLIHHGADVNANNTDGSTCLHAAVEKGLLPIVQLLIKNGGNVNVKTKSFNETHPSVINFKESETRRTYLDFENLDCSGAPVFPLQFTPLHVATRRGHKEIVRLLLQCNANVDSQGRNFETALFLAVHRGCVEMTELILNRSPSLTVEGNKRSLTIAVRFKGIEFEKIALKLLDYGFRFDWHCEKRNCSFFNAVRNNHFEVVRVFLEQGARVNRLYAEDHVPNEDESDEEFSDIESSDHLERGRDYTGNDFRLEDEDDPFEPLILIRGPDRDENNDDDVRDDNDDEESLQSSEEDWEDSTRPRQPTRSCLHAAIETGNEDLIKLLLDRGADVNVNSLNCDRPILSAIKSMNFNIVKLLMEREINVTDDPKILLVAVQVGCLRTVKLLLDKGANVRKTVCLKDFDFDFDFDFALPQILPIDFSRSIKISAILVAADKGHENIVKLLLDQGARLCDKKERILTPLLVSIMRGHLAVVELLLKSGARPNLSYIPKAFPTPLCTAAFFGHFDVLKLLLRYGAVVNHPTQRDLTPLHISAEQGFLPVVKILLTFNADVNAEDNYNRTPLFCAAKGGHSDVVRLLINNGAHIATEAKSLMPLFISASRGHLETVETLLRKGASINQIDGNYRSAIFFAVENGEEKVVDLLLKHGAQVNLLDLNRITPLIIAVETGNLKIVNALLKHGASVDFPVGTALSVAVKGDHSQIVELLLQQQAIFKSQSERDSALLNFAQKGDLRIVEILLKRGADTNSTDCKGRTAVFIAAEYGHACILELLLNHGSNFNAVSSNGKTPLAVATEKGFCEIVKFLLKNGGGINCADLKGRTALHFAAEHNREDILKLFLKHGAEPNICDANDKTSLSISAEKGHAGIVKLLLMYGANVNAMDTEGKTALHFAAEYNYLDVIYLLAEYGAEINAVTKNGRTPLSISAEAGLLESVIVLLKSGANVQAADCDGCTALHFAAENGHYEVVKVLIENNALVSSISRGNMPLLLICAELGFSDIVHTLMKFGISFNVTDHPDLRAYLVESLNEQHWLNSQVFKFFIEYGSADFELVSENTVVAFLNIIQDSGKETICIPLKKMSVKDWESIKDMVILHVYKMKAANLFKGSYNLKGRNFHGAKYAAFIDKKLKKEVEFMKAEFVGDTSATFYDVLTKNLNYLALLAKNKRITSDFDTLLKGCGKFSHYHSILRNQLEKGKIRRTLIDQAFKILHPLAKMLPHDIMENIVMDLSNKDLRHLLHCHREEIKQNVYK